MDARHKAGHDNVRLHPRLLPPVQAKDRVWTPVFLRELTIKRANLSRIPDFISVGRSLETSQAGMLLQSATRKLP